MTSPTTPAVARTLILSDLHLGNGGAYDVFAGEDALPDLLDRSAPARVIVNGDGIDFLMNDDPLRVDRRAAAAQAVAIVEARASASALRAFGRVLARGGEVIVRLGNHDVELAFPEVQEIVRGALGQPRDVAARLVFQRGDAPALVDVGGARLLVTHGEHNDPWNRVDYAHLAASGEADDRFEYAAGSTLVKTIMNPIVRGHGLRFVSLLKPDFQGGALTALAVAPAVVKMAFQDASLDIAWQLFRRASTPLAFAADDAGGDEPDLGLAARAAGAGLTPDEVLALDAALDGGPAAFGRTDEGGDETDDGALGRARAKLAIAGLRFYAGAQRSLAGDAGDAYFRLEPDREEWREAERLAAAHGAGAVIVGHTHAARFRAESGLVLANTGTWIWLMKLPRHDAGDAAWAEFLAELRRNPGLAPEGQRAARTFRRLTAVIAEPHAAGGASLSLVEHRGGALDVLGTARVPPPSAPRAPHAAARR